MAGSELCAKRYWGEKLHYPANTPPPPAPCRRKHLDDAGPEDVKQRAKEQIAYIKRRIAEAKKELADYESQLAEWEKLLT